VQTKHSVGINLGFIYMLRFFNEKVRGLQMSAQEHVISIDFSAGG
jgi:hypothetical protein